MRSKALFRWPGDRPGKSIAVMKLFTAFLLAACLHVQAAYGQGITLSEKGVTLEKIFRSIYQQTGYQFIYNNEVLQDSKVVDIQVKDARLEDVLRILSQRQSLEFVLENKTIVVKARKVSISAVSTPVIVADTGKSITMMIADGGSKMMSPLAGVTIFGRNSGKGTQSNNHGIFMLRGLPSDEVLVISCIGYEKQILPISRIQEYLLIMKPSRDELDKAVVQAYGTTSRRLNTGNIGKVSSEEIEKQPVMNPLLALEGRVAGLVVTPGTGYASGPVKVEIRGRKLLNEKFSGEPLYIIDGVPLTVLDVQGLGSGGLSQGIIQSGVSGPAGGQSPLFSMNPADIESIEVLKDADATAIYGSRGANGVILITTKKGKAGDMKFNLRVNQGFSKVTRHWDMLNTQQYLEMRREAFRNDGIVPTAINAPDLFLADSNRYTDWQSALWGGAGKVTNVNSSFSGGDQRTAFLLSAGYNRQTELMTDHGANQRANMLANINYRSADQKFSLGLSANYSHTRVDAIPLQGGVDLPPNAPAIYNKNGDLNFDEWNAASLSYPFSAVKQEFNSQSNTLTGSLSLNYEIVKGLLLSATLGYNNIQSSQESLFPLASMNPINFNISYANFGKTSVTNRLVEPQLNYTGTIGKGKLSVLAGASTQSAITDGNLELGFGYSDDAFIHSISGAAYVSAARNYGEYKYAAVFGRINYNWAGKYILNLNARRDGSSRFGPGKQFGNFGSAGLAWIATEEKWLRGALPAWIGFVKLRGSYGVTGSDAVGDYQYLSQWSGVNAAFGVPLYSYNGVNPLVNQHPVNQEYQWQTTRKLEGALSLSFLKDSRISLEIAYYRDRCNNQLTQYPTALFTGFGFVTANWPATVQNSGFEVTTSARLVNTEGFSWSMNFNIGINRNKLVSYPGISESPYATQYKVGHSISTQYVLHTMGIDRATGQYIFFDHNHDGKVLVDPTKVPGEEGDDRYVAVDLSPVFTGGMGQYLGYKNFMLSMVFSFMKQQGTNAYYGAYIPGRMANSSRTIYGNHWRQPGDHAAFARLTTTGVTSDNYFNASSDGIYSDASFVRLQNLAISYGLPERLIKKAHMQECKFFVEAQNVFVITGYKGLDPQTQRFGSLPPARVFTAGINFNF